MSKLTNPETEASISCGFYNTLSSDAYPRRYDAVQMSEIFNGIINDGIFMSIGDNFIVTANGGTTVTVGTGKCWFNSTWTENDAPFLIDCGEANTVLNRIDVIVIEVDRTEAVRDNTIKLIQGTASRKPVRPTLSKDNNVYQYPLCEIYRSAGSSEITQSNITNLVGTSDAPFITGILETVNIDELLTQWKAQWDEYISQRKIDADEELETFITSTEADFNEWYSAMKTSINNTVESSNAWRTSFEQTVLTWFEDMKGELSDDAAVNLKLHLDKSDVERILMLGLTDGTKTFSEDGTTMTCTDSLGRTLTKIFNSDFSKCTVVLVDEFGSELGRLVKTTSSDGKTTTSDVSIL